MKKNLRHLWLLLVGALLTVSAQQARATHAIGSDMNYINVGPGLYYVQYRFYRDCGGVAAAPTSQPLRFSATGCGTSGTDSIAVDTKQLPLHTYDVGNPYCGRVNTSTPCDSAGGQVVSTFPNYQVYTYVAIVNLGMGTARQCTNWRLTAAVGSRPEVANLVNAGGTDLYSLAILNNRDVPDDSSPAFAAGQGFKPLIFTCDSSTQYVGSPVTDPDNLATAGTDSLVYSLQQPLGTGGSLVAYEPGYSIMNPMRSLTGVRVTPEGDSVLPFSLNPNNGLISFTSGKFTTPPGNNNFENKYAFVVQVDSYRRLNGRRVKISTVRRDIVVVIFSCNPRPRAPRIDTQDTLPVVNTTLDSIFTQLPNDTIQVDACANAQVDLKLEDLNGDSIFAYFSNSQLPGQASVSVVGMQILINGVLSRATARLNWVPDSATIGGYYPVTFNVEDNGCPLPGRTSQTIILHVVRSQYSDVGLFTSNNNGLRDTLCVGQITKLVATTRRQATLGFPPQPAIYTYHWLSDSDNTIVRTNRDTAVVRPFRTTRYRLEVESPQHCIDTASILVRVDPTNRAFSTPDSVCPGQTATISLTSRSRRTGPGGVPIVYTYRWVDSAAIRSGTPSTLSNDSTQTVTAIPNGTTRYYATIYSSLGCTDTTSVVVRSKGDYPVFDLTQNETQIYRSSGVLIYGSPDNPDVPSLAATNDNGSFTYRIRGRENLQVFSDTTSATPSVTGLNRTTTYTLVAKNALGCETTRTFTIVVPLNVPNIITPNGDKLNDAFVIEGLQVAELTIYNRWGRKIKEWAQYDNKWDGDDLGPGTYYYLLRDKEQDKTYKGWVEIVR